MKAYEALLCISAIESEMLVIKNLSCDGSFLKGHTVNTEKCKDNKEGIISRMEVIQRRIEQAISFMKE